MMLGSSYTFSALAQNFQTISEAAGTSQTQHGALLESHRSTLSGMATSSLPTTYPTQSVYPGRR